MLFGEVSRIVTTQIYEKQSFAPLIWLRLQLNVITVRMVDLCQQSICSVPGAPHH